MTDPVTDGDVLARLDYMTDHRHVATIANWHQLARDAAAEVRALRDQLNEAQLRSIEARNPGIDMDEVRRLRAAGRPPTGTPDADEVFYPCPHGIPGRDCDCPTGILNTGDDT